MRMWSFAVVVNQETVLLFPSLLGFLFTSFLLASLLFFFCPQSLLFFQFLSFLPAFITFSSLILLCTYYRPSIIPTLPYICRPWRVQLPCLLVQPLTYIQPLINCFVSSLCKMLIHHELAEILSRPSRVSIITRLFKAASSSPIPFHLLSPLSPVPLPHTSRMPSTLWIADY